MITATEFVRCLGESIYKLDFTKADGTLRKMRATRVSAYIPSDKTPKTSNPIGEETTAVPVFDLDLLEWRSVTVKNIISMERV